ncbi:MAG: hypothetical protein WC756_06200 [Taibaiella sp.]|jgi:hypothetical protein
MKYQILPVTGLSFWQHYQGNLPAISIKKAALKRAADTWNPLKSGIYIFENPSSILLMIRHKNRLKH